MKTARSAAAGRTALSGAATARVRLKPTPQGVVYLWTIGLFSLTMLLLGQNLVFLLGALVLGCGAVTWVLARRNVTGLAIERSLPRRSRVGLPTPLTWTVANARRRPALGIEIEDRPARGLKPLGLHVEFPSVPAGAEARVTTPVVFGRRGRIDLRTARAAVRSRYPLGLFLANRDLRQDGQVLVRPAEGRVTERLRRVLHGRVDAEVRRRRVWRGDDQIYGVREFREGDDPRRIHWRSTARRGALVVSEWRAEQGREALIVLGRGLGAGPRAGATFERAVASVATLWRACARGNVQGRLILGGRADLTLEESGRGLERGLDALAVVPAQRNRRPRVALRRLRESTAARTVVYVATGPEPGLEQELAAAAGPGGDHVVLRADLKSLRRWIRGLA